MTALSSDSGPAAAESSEAVRPRHALLWIALVVAFSPVIVDLVRHQIEAPWSRYGSLFVLLLPWAASRAGVGAPPRRDGYLWIAVGCAGALLTVGGGMPRLARPAMLLALVGLARLLGNPPLRVLLLAAWTIPLPHRSLDFASPALESAWLQLCSLPYALLGIEFTLDGVTAQIAGHSLSLFDSDGGLPLVALCSGLGYYAALRTRRSLRERLRSAIVAGLFAIPLQMAGVVAALGLLAAGAPETARGLLSHGLWLSAAAFGLIRAERMAWRADRRRELVRTQTLPGP